MKMQKKKIALIGAMAIVACASMCHEINRAYCISIGDDSQVPWGDAEDWQKNSAINGVKFRLENPESNPEDSHNSWLKEKEADGWKYGKVKDVEKKEHPCFVPYSELPDEQKAKDLLFITTVDSFVKSFDDASFDDMVAGVADAKKEQGIVRYFAFSHLPANLQAVSKPIGVVAKIMDRLPPGAEKAAGMRKLLEAKDCFVRAKLG